jgi:hypothetical protein
MALTTEELDSLRQHLGYGNLSVAAEPYSPDTYFEVFSGVVSPNLSTGTETSSTTAITAGTTTTVTPAAMTDIAVYGQLVVDVGEQAEVIVVKAVTGSTFTAHFAKAHSSYPIATMSGLARLRLLLWEADKAWRALSDSAVGSTAGIKKVDEVEFFQGMFVLKGKLDHYRAIVSQIASLVQVPPQWWTEGGGSCRVEAY